MGIKRGQVIELTVSDIAFGGRGLAKVDGLAVFIDKAVPQDRILARIKKKKKNFAEAQIQEIIEPSPLRIETPCEYSGYCGGCKWQFLEYEKQLAYKTSHVAESIEHIGLMKDVKVLPTLPSEKVFGYRNKMEFSCSDKRWLMPGEFEANPEDKGFGIGLHVPGTFSKVLDIRECHIQPQLGNRILNDVRSYIKSSGVPVYGLKSHEGYWRFLMLRHSVADDNWMVNLVTSENRPEVVQPLADLLVAKYPEIRSVVNNITARKAGIAIGESEEILFGDSFIVDQLGSYRFEISANSFFQTNTKSAEALYGIVKSYAELSGEETVLDLYSGTGTIPIWLSEDAKEIIGIEIVESAVMDAKKNCLKNGVDNCRFVLGDIKDCLADISIKPDVLIIDPPRVGMHKDVLKKVLEMGPDKIVYVSCNPSTLSRDLLELKKKYHLVEVQPVDMFPHTYHIESVAKLKKILP